MISDCQNQRLSFIGRFIFRRTTVYVNMNAKPLFCSSGSVSFLKTVFIAEKGRVFYTMALNCWTANQSGVIQKLFNSVRLRNNSSESFFRSGRWCLLLRISTSGIVLLWWYYFFSIKFFYLVISRQNVYFKSVLLQGKYKHPFKNQF